MRETLTTLLKRAARSPEWPAARTTQDSQQFVVHHHAPQPSKPQPTQGHEYRLNTIDLNWADKHNLLPHSESIIYLSPSNPERRSSQSNLHLKIVWSFGWVRGRRKWQTGRGLNIRLLKMHRVLIEWRVAVL